MFNVKFDEDYSRLYWYCSMLMILCMLRISHLHAHRNVSSRQHQFYKPLKLSSDSQDIKTNPVDEMVSQLKKVLRSNSSQVEVDLFLAMVLKHLKDLNKPDTQKGMTIMMYATLAKQSELATILRQKGARLSDREREILSVI